MKISARRKARYYTVQSLYAWYLSKNEPATIIEDFLDDNGVTDVDVAYYRLVFKGAITNYQQLADKIEPYLDRKLTELDPIEQMILILAVYEFLYQTDVPYKVVINEAIELGKTFGAEDSYKYINGVLDKLAPTIRNNVK